MSKPFIPIIALNEPYIGKSEDEFLIHHDFAKRWQALADDNLAFFTIASLSFGTGFDFLTTWNNWLKYAPKSAKLYYFSSELRPLTHDALQKTCQHWPELARLAKDLVDAYPVLTPGFHSLCFDNGRVNLTLMLGQASDNFEQLVYCGDADIEKKLRHYYIDAWYCHHNDKIDRALGAYINLLSTNKTTLTSQQPLSDMSDELGHAGFRALEHYAIFSHSKPSSIKKQTPWYCHKARQSLNKKVIVLGAGLAGCFSANALARRGFDVLLIDALPDIAMGASSNPQAIIYPVLSAFSSPLTEVMLNAYLYAHRYYAHVIATHSIGELSGILQLALKPKDNRAQHAMAAWLESYPELGRLVTKEEASLLAGISLTTAGMYLPLSGWIDCRALCLYLVNMPSITVITDYPVKELNYESGQWFLDHNYSAETLILANSTSANQFHYAKYLPLKPASGQLTMIASHPLTESLLMPVCASGHILPARHKQHVLGATYHQGLDSIYDYNSDNQHNLSQLLALLPELTHFPDAINHWQGFRATTPDYLPIVGAVPERETFLKQYALLADDVKRYVPLSGAYYPGLYVCAGFGSRGLTSLPFCAEFLARIINKEPDFLEKKHLKALSPARFLIKELSQAKRP